MGPILGLLLGDNPVTHAINTVIDRVVPDKEAAAKAKRELADQLIKAEIAGDLAQIQLNTEEAKNPNVFVAGWRPFIGWVGGSGFAVQFVVVPLIGYVYSMFGHPAPPPLTLDPILYEVILGLLGINIGARTMEKLKGVAS